MNFPREEFLDLSEMTYVEEARWRLFKDVDNGVVTSDLKVLLSLGDHYTVMSGEEFKLTAERILRQL